MVFGVFDALLRGRDETNGTVSLAAQAVWHFLQGVSLRVDENPIAHPEDFQKYIVSLDNSAGQELYFLKSLQTGRWWLATPQQDWVILKVTACSKTDYEKACNNEIPDRWCKLIQR